LSATSLLLYTISTGEVQEFPFDFVHSPRVMKKLLNRLRELDPIQIGKKQASKRIILDHLLLYELKHPVVNSLKNVDTLIMNGANPPSRHDMPMTTPTRLVKEVMMAMARRKIRRLTELARNIRQSPSVAGLPPLSAVLWRAILFRQLQDQLCADIVSKSGRLELLAIAREMNIPVSNDESKSSLCDKISDILAAGAMYTPSACNYLQLRRGRAQDVIQSFLRDASKFGINVAGLSPEQVLREMERMSKWCHQ
jgi:hypothetical protein